jgi:ribosome recycling factor
VRAVRRDGMEQIKVHEKKHEIGEDVAKDWHGEVQKLTDQYIKKVDEALTDKEKDIRQV